jgi:hypothetical protein
MSDLLLFFSMPDNLLADSPSFESSHFTQSAKVPLSLTELGCQKRIHEIFGHSRSDGPAAHAEDIHVVVLHPLPS